MSYPEKDEESDLGDFRRLYALAELEAVGGEYRIKHLNSVPFQTVRAFMHLYLSTLLYSQCMQTSNPGPPVHPRIQLIYGGSIISVQFGEAVALCARGGRFRASVCFC